MFRFIKILSAILMLSLAASRPSFGFSLNGPINEPYQLPAYGYKLAGDEGAPKNLAQGYRWNTPTNYYSFDYGFATYFLTNGMAAVDSALAMFTSLSNVSSYSSDLSEWPLTTGSENYAATALGLLDVKSTTMSCMCEELGLTAPERWVWTLHDRNLDPGSACPNYTYIIIQRNYDPVSETYSPYINGNLFGYEIFETCEFSPNPYPYSAVTIPIPSDPNQLYLAVASFAGLNNPVGNYFTGFSRDDIGGLRYLYSKSNIYEEFAETNSLLIVTNQTPQLLVTSNLGLFISQAQTNNAAALQALYPGLIISSTSNYPGFIIATNITGYFTNPPFAPAGTFELLFATNYTTNAFLFNSYTFGNVVTNHYYTNGYQTIQTISFTNKPYAPAGTFTTLTNYTTTVVPMLNGDFYILPTNLCGPYQFIGGPLLIQSVGTTNPVLTTLTNTFNTTTNPFTFTENIITYTTNYTYEVLPVDCVTNTLALREGMEHITFVKIEYDSIVGTAWNNGVPITNTYYLTAVTNGVATIQTLRRVVTQPDILFSTADLATATGLPINFEYARTAPNWNGNFVAGGTKAAGPGTIQPGVEMTFNTVGPAYFNSGPFYVNPPPAVFYPDSSSSYSFQWGSFDGTTNAPVIYSMDGLTLQSLAQNIFFQVLVTNLATSLTTNGVNFSYSFQASGGIPFLGGSPYSWSLASGSAFPGSLTLNTNGLLSGSLSGVASGIYDFTVQASDSGSRVSQAMFSLTVYP